MLWPKVLGISVTFSFAVLIGVKIAPHGDMTEEGQMRAPSSLTLQSMEPLALNARVKNLDSQTQAVQMAWKTIKSKPIKDGHAQLQKVLGADAVGLNIFHTLQANALEQEVEGAADIRAQGYLKARQNSANTIKKIKNALLAMDANTLAEEKLRLLDIAAQLEGVDDEIKELGILTMQENIVPSRPSLDSATTEKEINQALSTNFAMFVPVVGLSLALGMTTNPNEALSMTLDGIKLQPDPLVQKKMAESLIQKFPAMTESLSDELQSAQIKISLVDVTENTIRAPASISEPDSDEDANRPSSFLIDSAEPQPDRE